MVSKFTQPQYAGPGAHTGSEYPLAIDASIEVMKREAARFAPHQNEPSDMTVIVDPGYVLNRFAGAESLIGAQQTPSFVAPLSNPRKDRLVVDVLTGVLQVVEGVEAAVPAPPAIPDDTAPLCVVNLTVGMTEITNADIDDSSKFTNLLGFRSAAFQPMWTGASDPLTAVLSLLDLRNGAGMTYAAGGTANALTITPFPAATAYVANQRWVVRCTAANTGAATLNVSGLGAIPLRVFGGGTALRPGDLIPNMYVEVVYDNVAGVFQILGQTALPPGGVDFQEFTAGGTWTKPTGAALVMAWVIGGGGGGGGTTWSYRGGGGGGAGHLVVLPASSFAAAETVTVGAGGAGNPVTPGSGGNSSIGSVAIGYGGGRGWAANSPAGGGGGGGGIEGAGGFGTTANNGGQPSQFDIFSGGRGWPGGTGAFTGLRGWYGGGGGGSSTSSAAAGGASIWGGGGGGSNGGAGGVSKYAGNGGATNQVGQFPGGGGGWGTGSVGTGGAGVARVWAF